jgi:hypothetical protein
MSNISSISGSTTPYQISNQADFTQFVQDFKGIGSALQAGDLSTAQSALATFQQDLQGNSQAPANQPFGKNNPANNDFQTLASALQAGDVKAAQKAFDSLQTDLKTARKGHHHHHSAGTTPTTATPTSKTTSSVVDSNGDSDASHLNLTA